MLRHNDSFTDFIFRNFGRIFASVFATILLIILLGIGAGLLYNPLVISHNATGQAKKYVTRLNLISTKSSSKTTYALIQCSSDDHDGDGYATCTALKTEEGKETQEPISCTYRFLSTGCKPYTYNRSNVVAPQVQ